MVSYVSLEQRVPRDHPLQAIRAITNPVLQELSGEFDRLYAVNGRPPIAPQKLLRALLQVLHTIRASGGCGRHRQRVFDGMVARLRRKHLLSDEHFTVDEMLLEAWAGATSFQRKDG